MDAMGLAQMKRQLAWLVEESHKEQRELQSAELALEGDKKKTEMLRKKITDGKRKIDEYGHEIAKAEEEVRRATFNQRR